MMIRTVLVGLVASLGLTLPSGKQLDAWKRSAESWVNARLAEWDGQMPNSENAFVYLSEPAPSAPIQPATPAITVADVVKIETKAPELIPAKPVEMPTPATEVVPMPIVPTEPIVLGDEDLSPATEALRPDKADVATDSAFLTALNESVESFVADLARTEASAVVALSATEGDVLVMTQDEDLAFGTERGTEGLCILNVPTRKADDQAPAVVSNEAVKTGDEPDQAIVFGFDEPEDLNESGPGALRAIDSEPSRVLIILEPTPPATGDQLTRAVRLTREAVFAWASLLNGPAVVTISP